MRLSFWIELQNNKLYYTYKYFFIVTRKFYLKLELLQTLKSIKKSINNI